MTKFAVRILGAGSATPAQGRHPTAQLLTHDHEHYLIDCGEGTQFRLLEHKARIGRLNSIFISHLHADHYLGLLGLISSLNLGGRTADLHLIGPQGLDEIIRVHLRLSQWPLGFKIVFEQVDATRQYLVFENSRLSVHTIPLDHRVPCAGFLFKEKPISNNIIGERLPDDIAHQHIKQLKDGLDVLDSNGNVL
jgi:ribonuclease Z